MKKSLSSRPGSGVEIGVRKSELDPGQEVPARCAISDVVTGWATFVSSRMELPNDVGFAAPCMPDQRARVSLSGEDLSFLDTIPTSL